MSRRYNMDISIGMPEHIAGDVIQAANREWSEWEDGWHDTGTVFINSADGSLCGGMSEEDFVIRVSRSIWEAAGKYLQVTVTATYLEELPQEHYELSEEDYKKWKEK